mmetsp:Transcript_27398/g.85219  ORF Transcript_27398/g.85219 Transcript_27398/m.85219 type:complete len:238 (-) Transcript_27398:1175-1888(-)
MHVSPRVRLGVASTSFLDVEYRRAARRRRTSGQAVEGKRERRGTPRRVLGALGGRGGARPAEHLIAAAAAARARARARLALRSALRIVVGAVALVRRGHDFFVLRHVLLGRVRALGAAVLHELLELRADERGVAQALGRLVPVGLGHGALKVALLRLFFELLHDVLHRAPALGLDLEFRNELAHDPFEVLLGFGRVLRERRGRGRLSGRLCSFLLRVRHPGASSALRTASRRRRAAA